MKQLLILISKNTQKVLITVLFIHLIHIKTKTIFKRIRNNVFVKSANKRNVEGTVSTYNAVFTGITKDYYNNDISARAYVCIDGMYFYSPVTTRSFAQVANAIIADEEIDQNTKNEVKQLLKEA